MSIATVLVSRQLSQNLSQMPNRKALRKQKQATSADRPTNLDRLQEQVQKLVQKKSYRQAIEKIKQISKMHPEAEIRPTEAEIWALQGQQEYHQGNHRQAQASLHQAIELGTTEESYYWLARSLMVSDDGAAALEAMRSAFENKILTKDYAGCYLKLLLLQKASTEVADLLRTQTNRFSVAQINWAKGFLALKSGELAAALGHFQKMDGYATPGDSPEAWIVYTQQQLGNWQQAEDSLNLPKSIGPGRLLSSLLPTHPALSRLSVVQAVSSQASATAIQFLDRLEGKQRILGAVVKIIQLLGKSDHHNAAHILQKLPHPCQEFPELDGLYRSIMVLAADQAMDELEVDCVVPFLESVVYEPPFDAQVAIKLRFIYDIEGYPLPPIKRLLNYFSAEVKKLAQEQPQIWPVPQLNAALAKINCWLSDACIEQGATQQGYNALQAAVALCPESPEVIGRQGLKAYSQGDKTKAIELLTKSLEGGCKYDEVYEQLLNVLKAKGDRDAVKDIQLRFGQTFEDEDAPSVDGVEIPTWIEALSSPNYRLFAGLIEQTDDQKNAAIKACQIFLAAVEGGGANSAGKVGFDQNWAVQKWQQLLQEITNDEKVLAIQAIFLTIQLFTKRQKGVAALQTDYLQQLQAIQQPEATAAYLMLWAIKGDRLPALQTAVRSYLSLSPQPGSALAQLQLQARYFTVTSSLRSLIDEFLRQDAQNPQLLLAKATTYPGESKDYQNLKEQGFDLARRLQDATALQAYRVEDHLRSSRFTNSLFVALKEGKGSDSNEVIKQLVSNMLGDKASPERMAEILPKLMEFFEDDDEDDFDEEEEEQEGGGFSFLRTLFGGKRPPPKNQKGRR
jgi:tetratricopeptide (TPR) repeat protein